MNIEIINAFDEYYALVQEQNDWTGNYTTVLRKVRGPYGDEFIRHNGAQINVKTLVQKTREDYSRDCDARKFYREYLGRV